ncbi:MAG: lactate racemase domain-containing protein [Kofleriaceae bacterium]
MLELPYGRTPYPLDLRGRAVTVVEAAPLSQPAPIESVITAALRAPIGRPTVESMVSRNDRVTVIVSDPTRVEPLAPWLRALRERLPPVRWTLAIATGTHGPCDPRLLGISDDLLDGMTIVNPDGHQPAQFVELGETTRGTPVRIHRCVLDADLVIATGCIRPHYFAGFGAGVKALFPGLGEASAVRQNHRLKQHPSSRAGIFVGNACRDDLEEAAAMVATPTFLLNGVCGPDGAVHEVVAGDPVVAFRVGANLARAWFTVTGAVSQLVIASDRLPVSASLYQAAKIAAAATPLVAPGGDLVIVAECGDGTGPLPVVNEAIFRIGVLPRLAAGASIWLVSSLPEDVIGQTLLRYAPSVEWMLERSTTPVLVIPHASQLILEPRS